MKKIGIICALLLGLTPLMQAQNETDALRYSQQFYQGTARSMAMGGAFGALGADFSSLSTNPAGLGLYRSSEFTITPELFSSKTESTYNGTFADDACSNFALSNLGFVLTTQVPEGSTSAPWKYYQFAFGMNRVNNFNNRMMIRGENPDHSRVDVYLDEVWNVNPQDIESQYPFDLYPAWYVYLLDTIRDNDGYLIYTSPVPQGGILQQELVKTWGSMNEWVFSGSANLNDVLFVGATLGMPYIRYFQESTYTESDPDGSIPGFDNWNYKENLETKGWGINLKLGVIAWPLDWLRVGAAFHTPTLFYGLKDTWYTSIDATLGPDFNRKDSPLGEYEYDISTPLRAIGSVAFIIGKYGTMSADYEYVDYSSARLRAQDYTFASENDVIRGSYTSTTNLRLGTEWRYNNFNFRGGYALYGSPYKDQLNDQTYTSYSFGLGYSERNFSLDLAYIHGQSSRDYYLYSSPNFTTNATSQTITTSNIVLTTRFKF